MLLCADYDVIVLSEPWLYKEINDNELGLFPNYSIFSFRCDRGSVIGTNIGGGGVLIAVKSHLHCYRIICILLQNINIEQSFVSL